MKKKKTDKSKSPFRWPFNKHRMGRIDSASRLVTEAGEAAEAVTKAGGSERGDVLWMVARRCARKFERAGSLFVQAGMGAAAFKAFHGAATCWDFAQETNHAEGCREAAASLDTFYPPRDEEGGL